MLAILDRVKSFAKPPLVIGTAARADDVDSQIRSRFGATLRVDMPGRPARKTAWQLPMLAGVVAAALAVGLYVHANPFISPPSGSVPCWQHHRDPTEAPRSAMCARPARAYPARPPRDSSPACASTACPCEPEADRPGTIRLGRRERRGRLREGTSPATQRQVGVFVIGVYASRAAAERAWRAIGEGPHIANRLHDLHVPGDTRYGARLSRATWSCSRCSSEPLLRRPLTGTSAWSSPSARGSGCPRPAHR